MRNLAPERVKQLLAVENAPLLLDVREEWEYEICHIDSSSNIPMGDVPGVLKDLDPDAATIVICHHGARSMQVADYLESAGFSNVINLDGGINAWAMVIDPNMRQY